MYVRVSLKIDLDASAPLSDMERQIQQAGRAAMTEALKQAISQSEEQQKCCPAYGSEQAHTRDETPSLADQLWTSGSVTQAALLSAVWSALSPGGALFGRGQWPQRHA
jgi:hypothetical protein